MPEQITPMVRRLAGAINSGGEPVAVDELFAPRAERRVKRLFAEFRKAFPDWREEIVALVAEKDTIAGRFRSSGTYLGEFQGKAPQAGVSRMSRRAGGGIRLQQEDPMPVARDFDPPRIHYFRTPH